ncbi:MAG: hypothetical protein R3318_00765 [Gammaproteobacteria bacterium]|nr:hypothetical protein [Gammaproteobacteria bacterium]
MDTLIKKRKLPLKESVPDQDADRLGKQLVNLDGIEHVSIEGDCLTVAYDVLTLTVSDIVSIIGDEGLDIRPGLWMELWLVIMTCQDRNDIEEHRAPFGVTVELQNIYIKCRRLSDTIQSG